jgi:SAM-dependent methyltransferase
MLAKTVRWLEVLRAKKVARILQPHIHGRTLDVGCFNGEVASRLKTSEIVGIDVVDPPQPLVPVMKFDGLHLPFADASFDTVLASVILHHAREPRPLLEEMARVGRRLVVFEDDVDRWWSHASTLGLHRITSRLHDMPYERAGFRTTDEWLAFFKAAGLEARCLERHPGTQPPWPLLRHTLFVLERA